VRGTFFEFESFNRRIGVYGLGSPLRTTCRRRRYSAVDGVAEVADGAAVADPLTCAK